MSHTTTPSAADIAYKAMADARAKLKAAGVDYYVVVAWNGLIAEDASVSADNAQSIVQRLDAVGGKLLREHPQALPHAAQ
jgi:hypothetical protein